MSDQERGVHYYVDVAAGDEHQAELLMARVNAASGSWFYRFDRASHAWIEDPELMGPLTGVGGADSATVRAASQAQAEKLATEWGGSLPPWNLDDPAAYPLRPVIRGA